MALTYLVTSAPKGLVYDTLEVLRDCCLHMQAELAEATARSAAAHEEYEGSLREAQLSAQSAHAKAESADVEWRRAVLQLQEKVAALQV